MSELYNRSHENNIEKKTENKNSIDHSFSLPRVPVTRDSTSNKEVLLT